MPILFVFIQQILTRTHISRVGRCMYSEGKISMWWVLLFVVVFYSCSNREDKTLPSNQYIPSLRPLVANSIKEPTAAVPDTLPMPQAILTTPRIKPGQNAVSNIKRVKPTQIVLQEPVRVLPKETTAGIPVAAPIEPLVVKAGQAYTETVRDPHSRTENPFSFGFYGRSQGLQHDDISAIAQDMQGNMWFATYGAGIIRYDGTNFSYFDAETGLPDNQVLSMIIDSKGNIWIGTRVGGLIRFDGVNYYIYNTGNGLSDNSVEAILEDAMGNIWAGTYAGGLNVLSNQTIVNYTSAHGLAGDIIYSLAQDQEGKIWIGTLGNGISMFDGEAFYSRDQLQGFPANVVLAIRTDQSGNIWFATDGAGLLVLKQGRLFRYSREEGMPESEFMTIFADRENALWIGSRTAGLLRLDNDRLSQYSSHNGLANNFVTSINQDSSGKIWFGTYGGGVGQYNGDLFHHFGLQQGLDDSFVRAINQDIHGNLWLGSNMGGAVIYDGERFSAFNLPYPEYDNRIRSIINDSEGNIWIGTFGGQLIKYDHQQVYAWPLVSGEGRSSVTGLLEDRNGRLWITTNGQGLFCLVGDSLLHFGLKQGLKDLHLRKIVEDKNGNLWIASRSGGLILFDHSRFHHYSREGGLATDDIFDLKIDSRNILWLATNGGGLYAINEDSWFHFTDRNGLGSNFIYSILEDSSGDMWFGTRMGLSHLLYAQPFADFQSNSLATFGPYAHGLFFKNFSRNDGFLGIGCNSRAIFQDKNGSIWVGANDILTVLNRDKLLKQQKAPMVNITGLGLFHENVVWHDIDPDRDNSFSLSSGVEIEDLRFQNLQPWYNIPERLSLFHDNNYIQFRFSAITTRFADQVRYAYKLEGFDEFWQPFSRRNEAHYGNLPPGNYTFRLRGMNSDGLVSDELQYRFQIRKPWWITHAAVLGYVLLMLTGFWFFQRIRLYRRRQKETRRQEELLLHQEVEIARKSVVFKQNFLANMSHEIRTPLTGILGTAELMSKSELTGYQQDLLETMIHSGENLRETINLVLDYSKIEAGKVKLREESFPVSDLGRNAVNFFHSICKKEIEFSVHQDENLPQVICADKQRLSQVVNNLISNAVKFTDQGSVTLVVDAPSGHTGNKSCTNGNFIIRIQVKDTGKGISEDEQKLLFKPFSQVEQDYDRQYEGTGLGLAICRELTSIMGGEIGVSSIPGQGSNFRFTFKASRGEMQKSSLKEKQFVRPEKALRILLVEDKIVNRKVIGLMLKSLGHTVTFAENGQVALSGFAVGKFDLILMDVQMPVMDGITAIRKLRENFHSLPPVVGLSANAFEGDRERYMSQGMDEYLTKPIKQADFEKLLTNLDLK